MFSIGDIVQAKREWLDRNETQADTIAVVVDVWHDEWLNKDKMVTMNCKQLNDPNWVIKPQFATFCEYYELVKEI